MPSTIPVISLTEVNDMLLAASPALRLCHLTRRVATVFEAGGASPVVPQ
jgi:hypothetical protein